MSKSNIPVTPAVRLMKQKKVDYTPFVYTYQEKGGTRQFAQEFKVDEHSVIKTLIMEGTDSKPFIVLMHGDMEVSTKELARIIGTKSVRTCSTDKAYKFTGYQFGGTSPFGTRKKMDIYVEKSILGLEKIYINGGKRGFIIEINPLEMAKIIQVNEIEAGIEN